jgi:iron complex transport system permease protein
MVSPDILGASAGAGFGAAWGILLSLPAAGIQALSFVSGLAAVALSYLISKAVGRRDNTTLVLVLSGMVVSALFSAFVSIVKYMADPYSKLPEITYWLMGSLSSLTAGDLLFALAPALAGALALMLVRWRLNVLAFGDEEAAALGVHTGKLRFAVILSATVVTSSVVSVSGQVGWVGLVIPHVSRMLVGPNYSHLLPASVVVGGFFLLLVDNVARNLLQVEIPLGILTAVIGAPFFVYLLLRGEKGWA